MFYLSLVLRETRWQSHLPPELLALLVPGTRRDPGPPPAPGGAADGEPHSPPRESLSMSVSSMAASFAGSSHGGGGGFYASPPGTVQGGAGAGGGGAPALGGALLPWSPARWWRIVLHFETEAMALHAATHVNARHKVMRQERLARLTHAVAAVQPGR